MGALFLSLTLLTAPSVEALSSEARSNLSVLLDDRASKSARLKAAAKLERLAEPGVAHALCLSLPSEDGAPKEAIRNLLTRLDAAKLFRAELTHPDAEVRLMAARGAACVSDFETVSALVQALRDGTPKVRSAAIDSLAQLDAQTASVALTRSLSDDENPDVRAAAAQALGTMKVGCEALARARTNEQDDFTRILIEQALGRCQG